MKIAATVFFTLITSSVLGTPCNGAPGKFHVNPDGSPGGFIQRGTMVEKSNYISLDSEVCGHAILRGNNQILNGSSIRDFVTLEGASNVTDSQIYGYAIIKGLAVIQSSEICQSSMIEGFKVIRSNYYCQTEDPVPKHPGKEGMKTELGIDSDGDGVRDDVEIFINNSLPNSPNKDRSAERISSKLYAKMLQKEILLKHNSESIKEIAKLKLEYVSCYKISLSKDIIAEMYNSFQRIKVLSKSSSYVHGMPAPNRKKLCKSLVHFSEKIENIN